MDVQEFAWPERATAPRERDPESAGPMIVVAGGAISIHQAEQGDGIANELEPPGDCRR
jgi:hypothetical protein